MEMDLRRTRPRKRGVLTGIVAVLGAIVLLGSVLVALEPGWLMRWDSSMTQSSVEHTLRVGTGGWWEFVAAAGHPWSLRIVLLLLAALAVVWRMPRIALWLIITVVLEVIVAPGAKAIAGRPRPEWADAVTTIGGSSFPSGHAAGAGMFATAMILLTLVVMRRGTWARRLILALWVALALLISVGRLYLGVHYPTDVIVGLCLGALTALVPWIVITHRPQIVEAIPAPPVTGRRLAVVYNPVKVGDADAFRARVTEVAEREGFGGPHWFETTVEDPGSGQAHAALAADVELIVVAGGDGTVRMVCQEAARTGVPVAILPSGTGNLLARNLGLPLNLTEAIEVAFAGDERAIDLVHFRAGRAKGDEVESIEDTTYLVMAGLGMDAAIMTGVRDDLKAKVGYLAYFVSGIKALAFPATKVHITIDDEAPRTYRARTVVVGNVGFLQGGLPLIPEAEADDGLLDVIVLAPKRFVGWLSIAWRIMARRKRGNQRLERLTGRRVEIRAEKPTPMQLDGDPIGEGNEIAAEVRPGVLLVRVPRKTSLAKRTDD